MTDAEKLDDRDWDDMEFAARCAVVNGGIAAMGYYRAALAKATKLRESLNPSTEADIQATRAILQDLNGRLPGLSGALKKGYAIFAEELALAPEADEQSRSIHQRMTANLANVEHIDTTAEDFQESFDNCISVLFDALDGTTNFRATIPLFCSAVAFFIGGKPRIGAIYDPHHNVVYCGSIRNNEEGKAYAWEVQSGNTTDLVKLGEGSQPDHLISLHLPRSNKKKKEQMLQHLGKLTAESKGTYMLCCGQLALTYVAKRNLTAFINNHTNMWDVAAGEVLVRAVGGKVTDLTGKPIDYRGTPKIGVIASTDSNMHKKIVDIFTS